MKNTKQLFSIIALGVSLSISSITLAHAETPNPFSQILQMQNQLAEQPLPSLAPMLDQVLPAVVSIKIEGTNTYRNQLPKEFRFFFGQMLPEDMFPNTQQSHPFQGMGSGVIINAEKGYVVTNNHVIENADKITVELNDGREFDVKLIGKDTQSDIALLQINNPKNLTEVKIADSDVLRVGDFTVAIGNPFGLGQTVTSGIVSALARSGLNVNGLENFIQTDASINRGNSGGALLNWRGELIGINTAIIAPGGGNIGIGFAIPSNMVKDLTEQLLKYGEVKRGLLGIKGQELTSDIAKAFNIDIQKGAFVAEVLPKSAAEKAGIKAGDVITSLDNKPINSFSELRAKIATMGAGKKTDLGLLRDGKPLTISVELQNNDEEATEAKAILTQLDGAKLSNAVINNQMGVKIDSIEKRSNAERLGVQANDLIIGVNREEVKNIADLRKIIDSKPSVIALNIIRGNSTIYLILR